MTNLFPKRKVSIFLIIALSLGFSSCAGGKSAVDTTWSLTKIVSAGDPINNSSTEIIEVKNCGIPIEKTTDCSAGTSNDLSLTLTSGGAFGVGSQFVIESSVGTTLGIGQQSGESVKLPIPPDGFIYTFTVSKNYQIVTGQILAHSSNGEEQVVNYNFHASCSIDITDQEQTSCSGNNSEPNNQLPATQVSSQTSYPDVYVAANAENGVIFTAQADGNYRFTIKEGIYCWGGQSKCRSIIHGYLNRDIEWGLWYNLTHPINQDYEIGCWEDQTAANPNCSVGQSTIVAMKAQQYIKWIIMEQKGSFGDDTGNVVLTVEKLP